MYPNAIDHKKTLKPSETVSTLTCNNYCQIHTS